MLPLKAFHRCCTLLGLLTLLVPTFAGAQGQRAVLEIIINEVSKGESLVVLRGRDVFVSVNVLTDAGLSGLNGVREPIGGEEAVSLASLAPSISYRVDERELRLHITADSALLGRQVRSLTAGSPANLVYRADTSGFVNYAVNYTNHGDADGFAESALSVKGALIYNTFSATRNSATRGLTAVSIDQRSQMRRWTFGDNLGFTGPLGGDAWIAGVTVAKEFAINPYFVRYPTLSLSTPISVPSVMEVQVNGQVVSREAVAPGRLELRNLPMTMGRNDAQIIIRDAFGVERALSSNYYLTSTALAQGVQEYQYSVGFRREAVGITSWDYRKPVALARHRVGISDNVTVGGRLELASGLANTGPSFNLRLPLGEIEAATAVSRRLGQWGAASQVGFTFTNRRFGAGGAVMVATREYTTLTPNPMGEDPATEVHAFASAAVGDRVSVTLQQSLTKLHQGLSRNRSGVLSTVHLARYVDLTTSVAAFRDERGSGREAYVGVTVLLGRSTASVAHVHDARGDRLAVDAQRSLPAGEGYGYQLHAENGDAGITTGVAKLQGRYGRYELRQESIAGAQSTTVSAMGSIVGIGGGIYASRPIQDSFALIRVPGVEGVRGFASHQPIGKTGRSGDLLVPDLQAYYGNLLDVADGDIPLAYSVSEVGKTLALPYRGGAIALFNVQKVQRVTGRITVVDGAESRIPSYGDFTVTVNGGETTSPIGSSGVFYFEDLPAGTHSAVVRDRNGRECVFTVTVPASDAGLVNIGTLRCEARVR